jgi:hypothetical protein
VIVSSARESVPSYAREDLLAAVRVLAPRLRAAADEIEDGRSLTEPLVQAMVDAGLYRAPRAPWAAARRIRSPTSTWSTRWRRRTTPPRGAS